MALSDSRMGSDLTALQPQSFSVPAVLAGTQIGANLLAGVQASDGRVEEYAQNTDYNKVLVATREFDPDAGDVAHRGLESHLAVKLDTDVTPDQTWLGQTAYAVDASTASLDSDSAGNGTGDPYTELGPVVQVDEPAEMVYVQVTE